MGGPVVEETRQRGQPGLAPVDLDDAVQNYAGSADWEETLKVFSAERPADVRAYVTGTDFLIDGGTAAGRMAPAPTTS